MEKSLIVSCNVSSSQGRQERANKRGIKFIGSRHHQEPEEKVFVSKVVIRCPTSKFFLVPISDIPVQSACAARYASILKEGRLSFVLPYHEERDV